ncbi:MAG TPA: Ldh family oxidoreductase [Acidimicrobiales bacterium]|nr:Ldh family oxidoreductase [Acidimicrobiales bacterium]
MTVRAESLTAFLSALLVALGTPEDHAATVAGLLVEADLRGVDSHGAHLMALYVSRIRSGHIRPAAEPSVIADDGATVHLDAGLGLGQVAGLRAVSLATERSARHGTAVVAVREATHLGALGAYTQRVAQAGHIAMLFQNGPTFVPPYGGVTPIFSTNPVSYAVPTGAEPTIVYDVATTAVAGNKVLLAKKRGDPTIPPGWANDEHGRPTTDTAAASVRHLQWFGGHKGFGLGLLVELMAGVLAGSSFGHIEHTASPLHGDERVAKGFTLLAIDPSRFMPLEEFRGRVDTLVREVRASARAEGVERIWLPGEPEHETRRARLEHGIPLPAALVEELNGFGRDLGVAPLE